MEFVRFKPSESAEAVRLLKEYKAADARMFENP